MNPPVPGTRPAPTPSGAPAIEVTDLSRSFGDHVVLDGVSLRVDPGRVLALLGPNGAGKTTVVQILSTLLAADSGTAHVLGHDVTTHAEDVRSVIGVTGQFSAVDGLMTGAENLDLMARLRHLPATERRTVVADLLQQFDLEEAAHRPVSTYSGGMRRRLDLAMTLIGDPRVIYLDEPTTGLDPRSRRALWAIIRTLVARGVTVLLTTQYLEEADQLADQIVVLDHGRVVAAGTPAQLKAQVPGGHVRLQVGQAADATRLAATVPGSDTRLEELAVTVPYDGSLAELRHLLDSVAGSGVPVDGLTVHTPDLDDVFLALTDHPAGSTAGRSTEGALS